MTEEALTNTLRHNPISAVVESLPRRSHSADLDQNPRRPVTIT